jgi:RNA polymerase sigma factor (sigma-70 family)
MRAAAVPARLPAAPFRTKRLLALWADERLVEQIRLGNEAAFEVAFERHGAGILAFCRHMLGSREEAEDVVQHTFAAAFRDLQRDGGRPLALKPWLYSIARNRCVSVLRARRERPSEQPERLTAGLAEEVERREELRDLLCDLRELPEDQRAALLLSESGGLSHVDVATVLGCEAARVKALVFRARSGLIERRAARETPCEEIREQLANLRGGSLRRSELRHHLRHCAGCRGYREQVKQQRQMLAAALPVVPSLGLKSSVLTAIGLGGGSAGGGVAAGLGAGASASFGSGALAKVALVGVLAGGGAVAGKTAIDQTGHRADSAPPAPGQVAEPPSAAAVHRSPGGPEAVVRPPASRAPASELGRRRAPVPSGRDKKRTDPVGTGDSSPAERHGPHAQPPGRIKANAVPPGQAQPATPVDRAPRPRGRGPIEAPPAQTPVRRGPPNPKPPALRPEKAKAKATPPGHAKFKPAPRPVPAPAAEKQAAKPAPAADKPQGPQNRHEPDPASAHGI